MVFALDNLPAHLPSHFSTTLLLCITLPFSDNSVPMLVNSSAMDNFIDKSLVALTPQHLQHLSTPILLKLFNGKPTSTRDITHCLETTITFTNGQQQELQLLVTKLHPSASIVLGFSWLYSTSPCIDWPSLTLHLDWDNLTASGLVPFDVSLPSKSSKTMIDQLQTPLQLCSSSPKVLPTLIDSSASTTIPLHLQSVLGPNVPNSSASTSRAIQSLLTFNSNPEDEGNTTPPVDIKIIDAVPFAHILQDGTPTFQLQIMPALLKEHLHAETTSPECKMEEQILYKVVSLEYYEFADMFSKGSAKELPPHCSYDHMINLEECASLLFGKIYNMSKIKLWALKEYPDDMLSKGFICLSISTASTLVLFAKKKDGSLRLCVDYWGLTKVTKKN
ncbi:hypothetical protein E4T56_gene11429 [Termitomyces sp. T112]|nr:hypothetical protein E4T56_gene11429 [Termitomyces sp. T112]